MSSLSRLATRPANLCRSQTIITNLHLRYPTRIHGSFSPHRPRVPIPAYPDNDHIYKEGDFMELPRPARLWNPTRRLRRPRLPSSTSVSRPYRFHIAASWAGKPDAARMGEEMHKVPFSSDSVIGRWRDNTLQRHKSKHAWAKDPGEDFFFVQEMRNGSGVAFGVADGVGGWVESGVDPSLFSQSLMYHSHRYSRNAWAGEPEVDPTLDYEEREQVEGWELTPYACLDLAYGGVLREKAVQAGKQNLQAHAFESSYTQWTRVKHGLLAYLKCVFRTITICQQLPDNTLSNVIYKNPIQVHFFNCPKQLTKLPSNRKKFPRACIDSPSDAETYSTKLRDGDIVIAFTDGLSDNVFANEMVTICSLVARQGGTEDQQVQAMADRLVEYGRQSMMSREKPTPFENIMNQYVLDNSTLPADPRRKTVK
ncbi:Protein phosphatase 2C 7 [Paramarasmius palmivorus]|uniref:Protein phosphatase n=1 Tax=Paramarasmius palmivorus TaxID=297713 RepID=A0AAW0DT29_9AGAR